MKYTSSSEAAAAFLSRPRRRHSRATRAERCGICGGSEFRDAIDNQGHSYRGCARCVIAMDRIKLDFARATVAECLDCVSARINDCHARGVDPDHITNIAWQMLNDALHPEGKKR